jgi:peptidoglycan/xylan/chitin deacetylase (PgdA/CDA1 family)
MTWIAKPDTLQRPIAAESMPDIHFFRKRRFAASLAGFLAVLATLPCHATNQWPNGARAAVVLTYDDALESQLDHVVPELDAADFKATFFLSGVRQRDIDRWRRVAAEGHELGNHTIFHACSRADFPADARYTSEAYTPESMLKEIDQQNVLLSAIDGRPQHGFATPCGESRAGGQDYLEALRQAKLVTYARGVVTLPADLSRDVSTIDPMHVPSRGFGEGATTAQLIELVQQAESGGGWAVFLFHGVGGDYLQVSDAVHRDFIAWLANHRGEVWVTTLQQALDWARAHPGR